MNVDVAEVRSVGRMREEVRVGSNFQQPNGMADSVWGKEEKAGAAEVNLNKSELCKSAQGTRVIRCWCRRAGWLFLGVASGVQLVIRLTQIGGISPFEALLSFSVLKSYCPLFCVYLTTLLLVTVLIWRQMQWWLVVNIWNEYGRMKSVNNLTKGSYFLRLNETMKYVSDCSVIETRFET